MLKNLIGEKIFGWRKVSGNEILNFFYKIGKRSRNNRLGNWEQRIEGKSIKNLISN